MLAVRRAVGVAAVWRSAAANSAPARARASASTAGRRRRGFCSSTGPGGVRRQQEPSSAPSGFGIVFDIDGVLVRGGKQIPGANHVMDYLARAQTHADPAKRIPYIFLTNGGGCLEEQKAHEISSVFFPDLPVPVRASQVQLSHTPMKALVPEYRDKPVLALGCKDYVAVARAYGLKHVVTVEDVLHAHPELYPFKTYHKRHDLHPDPIAAVMIFHDPVQWAEDIQVLCDVIEGGVLAHHPEYETRKQHIPVYSSNADLVFAARYAAPRLAQGSFVEAWRHVWKTCYGGEDIEITRFGKPHPVAYRFAERLLVHEARHMGALPPDAAPHEEHGPHGAKPYPFRRVYAIGDNPASDIAGANGADGHVCEWVSILVRTGVHQDRGQGQGQGQEGASHGAKHVVDDVAAALRLIMELEGRSF